MGGRMSASAATWIQVRPDRLDLLARPSSRLHRFPKPHQR
jgi:hypothetical protein